MRTHLERATGNPQNYADIRMVGDLRTLLDLIETGEHLTTSENFRIVIHSTIGHYVELIVDELNQAAFEENTRDIPTRYWHMSPVNLASYVIDRLRGMYEEEDIEIDAYRNGYHKIFSKLIYVFNDSDFPFNREQHQLIRKVCQATRSFGGDPLASDFEEVKT